MPASLTSTAGDAHVVMDAEAGGRLSSLVVHGHELLVGRQSDPMRWGSFPMVPWAGRIRDGRFTHDGEAVDLPRDLPPHAIHGTTYRRPWTTTGDASLSTDLGGDWPWGGRAEQTLDLQPDQLTLAIAVRNVDSRPMPVTAGWHPWFRRHVAGTAAEVELPGARMWRRDAAGIPDGSLVDPPPGPWDDCFTDLRGPVVVRWRGFLELSIESTCRHVVVYDEEPGGVCVEPQSGPPDAHNSGVDVALVEPGGVWSVTTTWRWRSEPPSA